MEPSFCGKSAEAFLNKSREDCHEAPCQVGVNVVSCEIRNALSLILSQAGKVTRTKHEGSTFIGKKYQRRRKFNKEGSKCIDNAVNREGTSCLMSSVL